MPQFTDRSAAGIGNGRNCVWIPAVNGRVVEETSIWIALIEEDQRSLPQIAQHQFMFKFTLIQANLVTPEAETTYVHK